MRELGRTPGSHGGAERPTASGPAWPGAPDGAPPADLHVLLLEDLLVLLQRQDEKLLLKCHSKTAAGSSDSKQSFSPVLKLNAVLIRSVATGTHGAGGAARGPRSPLPRGPPEPEDVARDGGAARRTEAGKGLGLTVFGSPSGRCLPCLRGSRAVMGFEAPGPPALTVRSRGRGAAMKGTRACRPSGGSRVVR